VHRTSGSAVPNHLKAVEGHFDGFFRFPPCRGAMHRGSEKRARIPARCHPPDDSAHWISMLLSGLDSGDS